MSLILSIETSTKVCSVALHQSGRLLASVHNHTDKAASNTLTIMIEQVFQNADAKLTDLSAVAVAKGPGSYTGLRIGAATAKGLCYALEKPLVAVETLKAMACAIQPFVSEEDLLCPMIDARRMEVYCSLYNSRLYEVSPVEAKVIDGNAFEEVLVNNKVIFFGDGADKCRNLLSDVSNAHFVSNQWPSATAVGQLAWETFQAGRFEDLETFEPFYLKEFLGSMPKRES